MNRENLSRRTILFVDEVHRFNKSQQDAFLPHVESGLVTFIGATTENPSFELNNALLSRASVYVLKPLEDAALATLFVRALHAASADRDALAIDAIARDRMIGMADGDGRRLINLVEQLAVAAENKPGATIDVQFVESVLARAARRFDKGGDNFYDQISALHKSVRGSDPDASLYWFCRMLDGGADPRYLARRMIRMATEDIGLADPRALEITLSAADVYERLGSPEGELALAEAVIYLAIAAKSNAIYVAYNEVRAFIAQDESRLDVRDEVANDPFFGRAGRMLAANQRGDALKFEVVATIANADKPTAIVSCNCHQDHLTVPFGISTADGGVAHSACVGFGMERIVLALFAAHGMTLGSWPVDVVECLTA